MSTSFIPTEEFVKPFFIKPESARRSYCKKGHYLGIRPKKLPNGRLLWPVDEQQKVLNSDK